MSLSEFESGRRFTKYKRHVDESHERVSATTVNKIQDDVNLQQADSNIIKDTQFEERVYTIFNNNLYTNAMFTDYFKTGEFQDASRSSDGIMIDANRRLLTLEESAASGTAVSTVVYSVHGPEIQINDFFLIANENIPIGARIRYFIETSKGERWPILPNSLKLPMHLSEPLQYGFRVIIELTANARNEKPYLNGYAILYWDSQVEENYGMTNPDLMRFP